MRFEIIQDKIGVTWSLVTDAGLPLTASSSVFKTIEDAQLAIKNFRKWIAFAPISVADNTLPEERQEDWKKQAIEQLKKKHHT